MIRGIGYVAIYSAYLEETVDRILLLLEPLAGASEKLEKAPTAKRVKAIRARLLRLDDDYCSALVPELETCLELLEARNALIHDRIYAQFGEPDMLRPGRPDRSIRPVSSADAYDLANAIYAHRRDYVLPFIPQIRIAVEEWIMAR